MLHAPLPLVSSLALADRSRSPAAPPRRPAPPAAAAGRQRAGAEPSCRATSARSIIRSPPPPTRPICASPRSVLIDIEVLEATDTITLNAAELDFASVTMRRRRRRRGSRPTPTPRPRPSASRDRIAAGRHRLAIDYSGRINTQAAGLFALDYSSRRRARSARSSPSSRRPTRAASSPAGTSPTSARPTICASPSRPASRRSATCPRPGARCAPDGSTIVTFRTTPAMSSYLLFLAVGELDRITTTAAGIEIGVVTRRGAGEQGRWALESSARILPWYNDYFGTPYPLPKLDNVAGPGSSQFFGAMENWGAIFSFENILLVDPVDHHRGAAPVDLRGRRPRNRAPMVRRPRHHGLVGRSLAQRGLRLVDGDQGDRRAASRMGAAARPGRRPRSGRCSSIRSRTTHPVVQHLTTVEQISQAFDAITYRKGEAVITMLEDYVGEDAWRHGRARLYRPPPARQHHYRRSVARDRGRRPAGRSPRSPTISRSSPACR